MSAPPFSKDTPNKIGEGIDVSETNTLIKRTDGRSGYQVAIADEPIDTKVDGKKMFCVRVDNAGPESHMMIGFTPMETFDSTKNAYFGKNDFTGCGMNVYNGNLYHPVGKSHKIIDWSICDRAQEIIVILTISNNGKKKEIRFLCDGNETKSSDVSKSLEGDFLFPTIIFLHKGQKVATIPIDEIKIRNPEIDELIKENKEYQDSQEQQQQQQQQQENKRNMEQVKQARKDLLKQNEEMMYNFFSQLEQQANASDGVEVETKKDEMNAMEIYDLKRESGQRREREEEFKVKEEPK
jgi:hypothetical protein